MHQRHFNIAGPCRSKEHYMLVGNGTVEPANPIYAELIVRRLNLNVQYALKTKYKEYS